MDLKTVEEQTHRIRMEIIVGEKRKFPTQFLFLLIVILFLLNQYFIGNITTIILFICGFLFLHAWKIGNVFVFEDTYVTPFIIGSKNSFVDFFNKKMKYLNCQNFYLADMNNMNEGVSSYPSPFSHSNNSDFIFPIAMSKAVSYNESRLRVCIIPTRDNIGDLFKSGPAITVIFRMKNSDGTFPIVKQPETKNVRKVPFENFGGGKNRFVRRAKSANLPPLFPKED